MDSDPTVAAYSASGCWPTAAIKASLSVVYASSVSALRAGQFTRSESCDIDASTVGTKLTKHRE